MTILLVVGVRVGSQARGRDEYRTTILPLLNTYCFDCHGDGLDKGGFAIDGYKDPDALLADKKRGVKADRLGDSTGSLAGL